MSFRREVSVNIEGVVRQVVETDHSVGRKGTVHDRNRSQTKTKHDEPRPSPHGPQKTSINSVGITHSQLIIIRQKKRFST